MGLDQPPAQTPWWQTFFDASYLEGDTELRDPGITRAMNACVRPQPPT